MKGAHVCFAMVLLARPAFTRRDENDEASKTLSLDDMKGPSSYFFKDMTLGSTSKVKADLKAKVLGKEPTVTTQYNYGMEQDPNLQVRISWVGVEFDGKTGADAIKDPGLKRTVATEMAKRFKAFTDAIHAMTTSAEYCNDWANKFTKVNVGRKYTIPLESESSTYCTMLNNGDADSTSDCDGKYIVTYTYQKLGKLMAQSFPDDYDKAIKADCNKYLQKFKDIYEEALENGKSWTTNVTEFGNTATYLIQDGGGKAEYDNHNYAAFDFFTNNTINPATKLKIVGFSRKDMVKDLSQMKPKDKDDKDLCWTFGLRFKQGDALIVQRFNTVAEAQRESSLIRLMLNSRQFVQPD